MEHANALRTDVTFCACAYECTTGADALVIIADWEAFCVQDLDRVRRLLKAPIVVDLRNIYPPAEIAERGFVYRSVGRPQC